MTDRPLLMGGEPTENPIFTKSSQNQYIDDLESKYQKVLLRKELKRLSTERKKTGAVVTPLELILGDNAENLCKLDMGKAQEYLENQ